MKLTSIAVLLTVVFIGGAALLAGGSDDQQANVSNASGEVLARNGLHWHADLRVFKNGEQETIPAGIGLGITHNPLHTHDEDGVVHLEFGGRVMKDDTRLANFFEVWGRGFPSGEGVTMTVNGEASDEFGDYHMQDGDVIEVRYSE